MRISIWLLVSLLPLLGTGAAQEKQTGKRTEAEQKAIERIEEAGGSVREIAQDDDRLEVDFHLQGGSVAGDHLAALKDLPKVVHLHLGNTNVSDQGLAHLDGLTALTRLHLDKTKVTDAGLKHLKNLKNLTYLNLYGTAVGDARLAHLKDLPKLTKLFLWQTQVTDAGIADLRKALPDVDIDTGWKLEDVEKVSEESKPKEEPRK